MEIQIVIQFQDPIMERIQRKISVRKKFFPSMVGDGLNVMFGVRKFVILGKNRSGPTIIFLCKQHSEYNTF